MKIFLAICLVACYLAEEDLMTTLRSPRKALKLYSDFKLKQHLHFEAGEDRMRFQIFENNALFVATANMEEGKTAEFELNFFSTLTEEEKELYLGMNGTAVNVEKRSLPTEGLAAVPDTKLWTNEGAVTEVQNQGQCGSCWTYGAVGGLESRYKIQTGVLRKFAEQEYLDCVLSSNGCRGGWPDHCYVYSQNNGRLASAADYPYTGARNTCQGSNKPNSLIGATITGLTKIGNSEELHIAAIAEGPISVAFEATPYAQQYSRGILRDTTCGGRINHAVTAVGYTPTFILVKNSWGSHWGDHGFMKFTRHYANCGLYTYSWKPILTATGEQDTGASDPATTYRPAEDDTPVPPPCADKSVYCRLSYYCLFSRYAEICPKSCRKCNGGGACPSGTVRCSDGVCRHEHMC